MRQLTLLFVLALTSGSMALAQPEAAKSPPTAVNPASPGTYMVELTEYRLGSPLEDGLSANEIVERLIQRKNDGELDKVETLLLSALEGRPSFVHFSKRSAVPVGVTRAGADPEVQHFQERTAETQFELLATADGERTRLQVVYKVSRLGDDGAEHRPPSTSSVSIEATLLLEFEKPVLFGGSSAESPVYFTLTLHR